MALLTKPIKLGPEFIKVQFDMSSPALVGNYGFGCHAHVVSGIGRIANVKLLLLQKTTRKDWDGMPVPFEGYAPFPKGAWDRDTSAAFVKKHSTPEFREEVKSAVYEALWNSYTTTYASSSSCVVFSDSVNRGTRVKTSLGSPYGLDDNQVTFNTAGLALWLSTRPDLGILFSTPMFGNPNHPSFGDMSFCQVFVFIHKRYEHTIVSEGIPEGFNVVGRPEWSLKRRATAIRDLGFSVTEKELIPTYK